MSSWTSSFSALEVCCVEQKSIQLQSMKLISVPFSDIPVSVSDNFITLVHPLGSMQLTAKTARLEKILALDYKKAQISKLILLVTL